MKNPLEIVNPETKKITTYLKLQNGFTDKASNWIANYDDINKIYMKPDAGLLMMVSSLEAIVSGLNDNITKLVKHSQSLEDRIEKMEAGLGRRPL